MNVTRTQEFKDTIRKHQLLKGDMWELYKFRKRFNPDMYKDVNLTFWEFKHEAANFIKDPTSCKYKELFLSLQHALRSVREEALVTAQRCTVNSTTGEGYDGR